MARVIGGKIGKLEEIREFRRLHLAPARRRAGAKRKRHHHASDRRIRFGSSAVIPVSGLGTAPTGIGSGSSLPSRCGFPDAGGWKKNNSNAAAMRAVPEG